MIKTFLENPSFCLFLSFILLVGMVARPLWFRLKGLLSDYQQEILGRIHEAEDLLQEVEGMYQEALCRREENEAKIEEMFALSDQAIHSLQEQDWKEQEIAERAREQFLERHLSSMRKAAQQEVQEFLVVQTFSNVERQLSSLSH